MTTNQVASSSTSTTTPRERPRGVRALLDSVQAVEGDGFGVHRPFPRAGLDQLDPFLLLDEMGPQDFGPGEAKGASDHPHRGFETVTYVLDGAIEHRDSMGHVGHIGPGEAQWMTAAAGVVHAEQPAEGLRRAGGRLHGVQLWVNLPAAEKMGPPRYQDVTLDVIPEIEVDGVRLRLIAGAFGEHAGAVETHTPLSYLHASIPPGRQVTLPAPDGRTAIAYLVGGSAWFGPDRVHADHTQLVSFEPSGDTVEVGVDATADETAEVLVLTGEPLREPIARYGPFVMNTRAEIEEAFEDFRAGRLGSIPPS